LVVGVSAPLIGTFLVQKRMSLMGDGIGHVAFAGVAAGLLLGVFPIWTALAAAVLGAVGIEWLRLRGRAAGDLALAMFFYSGIAGAVVLSSLAHSLDGSVLAYLFGAILTVNTGDAVVILVLGVGIVGAIALCWRALFAVVLDEGAARVAGLPVTGLSLGLAAMAAVTVVASMRVVGVLLVAALMVLPVGVAQRMASSFFTTLLGASAVGAASVVVGLVIARVWGVAPGGTIVLVAAGAFALSSWPGVARRRGA
jgi:zinc transport system permease protein